MHRRSLVHRKGAHAGVRVVEIEVSLDLKEWKTIAYVPLVGADANSRFIRSRLATVWPADSP